MAEKLIGRDYKLRLTFTKHPCRSDYTKTVIRTAVTRKVAKQ